MVILNKVRSHHLINCCNNYVVNNRFNPAHRIAVFSDNEFVNVETLLSSVLPTTMRLHHRAEILTICGCDSMIMLGMMVSLVVMVMLII